MMSREPLVTVQPQQTEDGISVSLSHTTEPCVSHSEVTKDADANGVDPIQNEEVLSVVQHVTQRQQVLSIVQKPPRGRELYAIHDTAQVQKIPDLVWYQEHSQGCQQSSHQQNQTLQPPMDQSSIWDQDPAVLQEEGSETLLAPCMPFATIRGLMSGAVCEDEAWETGGRGPARLITKADELRRPPLAQQEQILLPPEPKQRHAVLATPVPTLLSTDASGSSIDGGDMTCSDLMSLKSDTVSLASEPAFSRKSGDGQDDDTTSVATSSVTSLFHRVQMDPMEKAWLRSAVLGNSAAQRQLLAQDPSLALKKDFVTGFTALHWAAKQGRLEVVDMMLHAGVDVNVRSHGGYTALHLASIHGHLHVVQALVNTYSAKTNVRDYHGKKAVHYWSGNTDVFDKPELQSGGTLSWGKRTQRYSLPSFRLSRSRSQGQLNPDFRMMPLSPSHGAFDLHV